ncbi:MAG: stage II sporulation protein M [Bacillota bacterium]
MINYRYSKQKLLYFFRHYLLFVLLILISLVVGLIAGSIAVKILSYGQKEELIQYLSNFSGEIEKLIINHQLILKDVITTNLKFVLTLWLLSLSVIGVIFVPVIIFFRGFILGFTVGFLVDEMFFKGLLLAIVAIAPQNLLMIPALILGALFCLVFSFKLFTGIIGGKRYNFINLVTNYSILMAVIALIFIIAAVIETYITPQLISLFSKFLGF